jgi:hypothetical protein
VTAADADGQPVDSITPIVVFIYTDYREPEVIIMVNETGRMVNEFEKLFAKFGDDTKLGYFCANTFEEFVKEKYDYDQARLKRLHHMEKLYSKYYPEITLQCLEKMEADRPLWEEMNPKEYNAFINQGRRPVRALFCDVRPSEQKWESEFCSDNYNDSEDDSDSESLIEEADNEDD